MRLSKSATALAVSLSLFAGAAGSLALAAPASAATASVDDQRALRVEQGFDALYDAIDRLADRAADDSVGPADRAAVDAALDGVLAATGAVRAADPEPTPPKGDDPVKAAQAKLKKQTDVLVQAAMKGDLLGLVVALNAVPQLAVDLLIQIGLGKLTKDLPKLPEVPGLPKIPGMPETPATTPPATTPAVPGFPKIPGLPF
ncbi:hypothetical protein ACQB60_32500 [Actinomycetota bacterium Odt1-20B]